MKEIISTFSMVLVILINGFMGIGLLNAGGAVTAAKEYKADVIAEIENSNFNPYVINGCIAQALDSGYELQVNACSYDSYGNVQTAEVILSYQYEIPILGIGDKRSTRGIAR